MAAQERGRPHPLYGKNAIGYYAIGDQCGNPDCPSNTKFTGGLNEACFWTDGVTIICTRCLIHEVAMTLPDLDRLSAEMASDPEGTRDAVDELVDRLNQEE